MNKYFLIIVLIFSSIAMQAQIVRGNMGTVLNANFTGAFQVPGGDLSERFGTNGNFGAGLDLILEKSNLIFGLEGNFIFGQEAKTDVLANLRTPEGYLVSNNRSFADVPLRERGFYFGALVGKLFSLSNSYARSGVRTTIGFGVLQHKIRIQDDPEAPVAALTKEYKKGYDRLSNGLALNEFIGYQILSKNRRINVFAGFEFTQAFTQNRREFNYDTMQADTEKRFDTLWGFRVGWVLPFYIGENPDEIIY